VTFQYATREFPTGNERSLTLFRACLIAQFVAPTTKSAAELTHSSHGAFKFCRSGARYSVTLGLWESPEHPPGRRLHCPSSEDRPA
jgi:hypothetical protein